MAHDRRSFLKMFAGISTLPLLTKMNFVDRLQAATQEEPVKAELSAESKAYEEVAKAKFGGFLSDVDLRKVASDIDHNVKRSAIIQGYDLRNSDEPDFKFSAK